MFATDEKVYINGQLSIVDHTYTSTNGTLCVHLYNGTNVPASSVMTYDAYWKRQRDMMALASQGGK